MMDTEKLQKAIQATIAAGYQLNSEAFEYLRTSPTIEDPVEVVNLALEKIEQLENKPLFIEKSFFRKLVY